MYHSLNLDHMANINWSGIGIFVLSALIIPAFVSWFSSDLRVAQMQKKRSHYLELVKSFEIWREDLHIFTKIGVSDTRPNEFFTQ